MNETIQGELSWEPFVWRGMLGGIIGMLVVVAVATIYTLVRWGSSGFFDELVIMDAMGLIGGVVTGIGVGCVIYKITKRRTTQPTMAARILIGTICVLTYSLFSNLIGTRSFHLTFYICYAVAVGGLAGLMARAKNPAPDMLSVGSA